MMTKVAIIALIFNNWDACVDYAIEHGIEKQHTEAFCTIIEVPVRPKARPDQGEKK